MVFDAEMRYISNTCFDWKCQKSTDSKYFDEFEKHSMDVGGKKSWYLLVNKRRNRVLWHCTWLAINDKRLIRSPLQCTGSLKSRLSHPSHELRAADAAQLGPSVKNPPKSRFKQFVKLTGLTYASQRFDKFSMWASYIYGKLKFYVIIFEKIVKLQQTNWM